MSIYLLLNNEYLSACSNDKNRDYYFGINYCFIGSIYFISSFFANFTINALGHSAFFKSLFVA